MSNLVLKCDLARGRRIQNIYRMRLKNFKMQHPDNMYMNYMLTSCLF